MSIIKVYVQKEFNKSSPTIKENGREKHFMPYLLFQLHAWGCWFIIYRKTIRRYAGVKYASKQKCGLVRKPSV